MLGKCQRPFLCLFSRHDLAGNQIQRWNSIYLIACQVVRPLQRCSLLSPLVSLFLIQLTPSSLLRLALLSKAYVSLRFSLDFWSPDFCSIFWLAQFLLRLTSAWAADNCHRCNLCASRDHGSHGSMQIILHDTCCGTSLTTVWYQPPQARVCRTPLLGQTHW